MKYQLVEGAEQPGHVNPKAEKQGRAAYKAGKSVDDNPYTIDKTPWSRQAWARSFVAAQADARRNVMADK